MEIEATPLQYSDLTRWSKIIDANEEFCPEILVDGDLFEMTKDIAIVSALSEGVKNPVGGLVFLTNQTDEQIILQYLVYKHEDKSVDEIMKIVIKTKSMKRAYLFKHIINENGSEYLASEMRPVNPVIKDQDYIEMCPEIPLPLAGRHRIAAEIWEFYQDDIANKRDALEWMRVTKNGTFSPEKDDGIIIYPLPEKLLVH